MGGIGSGWYERQNTKDRIEGRRSLDVRRWQRDGLLKPGWRFDWQWQSDNQAAVGVTVRVEERQVVLAYRCEWDDGSQVHLEYPVILDWTPCPFGGGRYWFRCPMEGCGRRVAILHWGSSRFACRRCQGLAYSSQREDAIDRNLRRARKIKLKLGGHVDSMGSCPKKPKRMRWRTYERLIAESDTALLRAMRAVLDKIGG